MVESMSFLVTNKVLLFHFRQLQPVTIREWMVWGSAKLIISFVRYSDWISDAAIGRKTGNNQSDLHLIKTPSHDVWLE